MQELYVLKLTNDLALSNHYCRKPLLSAYYNNCVMERGLRVILSFSSHMFPKKRKFLYFYLYLIGKVV